MTIFPLRIFYSQMHLKIKARGWLYWFPDQNQEKCCSNRNLIRAGTLKIAGITPKYDFVHDKKSLYNTFIPLQILLTGDVCVSDPAGQQWPRYLQGRGRRLEEWTRERFESALASPLVCSRGRPLICVFTWSLTTGQNIHKIRLNQIQY